MRPSGPAETAFVAPTRPDFRAFDPTALRFASASLLQVRRVFAGTLLAIFASLWWGAVKPLPWRVERDVPYAGGRTLDLYHPPGSVKAPPTVVLLHGGGWHSGDKRQVGPLAHRLSQAGYRVAAVNFRLAPEHQFPVPLEDLGEALEFLKARKVALVGMSSGGHLASLYALKAPPGEIAGVISVSAPTELKTQGASQRQLKVIRQAFGDQDLSLYSPVNYAGPKSPPHLLIHGEQDDLVPVDQSRKLHAKLGKRSRLLVVTGANHAYAPVGAEPVGMSRAEREKAMLKFLREVFH